MIECTWYFLSIKLYRGQIAYIILSRGNLCALSLDKGTNDLAKVSTLLLGNSKLLSNRLARTVTVGKRSGTPGTAAHHLAVVRKLRELVANGYKVDAVVRKEGDRSEGSRLLTTVLGAGRGEDTGEFADEGARGPETASVVKEAADLSRGPAVSGSEAKELQGRR